MVGSRPRVLVVSSSYPGRTGAVSAVFVRDQAEIIADEFDVAVLVPQVSGWRRFLSHGLATVRVTEEDRLTVCRSTARHPPLRPAPLARMLLRPPTDAQTGPGLINAVMDLLLGRFERAAERGMHALDSRWGTPDLVHAHFVLPGGWIGLRLARRLGVPMVLTEHSGPFEVQIETALRRRLVRETLLGANRVLAVSPFQAGQIRRFEPSAEVAVVGNPIRHDFFTPGPAAADDATDARTRFLTVARLTPLKGIDDLLAAGALLAQRGGPEFELEIVGDGPERRQLERLAVELGIATRVRFRGALAPEALREALRGCDALVLPSHHETFGIVLGEAMACGKPVVATRCGGPDHLVDESNGILVPVRDTRALAQAMATMATSLRSFDPEQIRAQAVDRFGLAAFRERMAAIYAQALEDRGPERSQITSGTPAATPRS